MPKACDVCLGKDGLPPRPPPKQKPSPLKLVSSAPIVEQPVASTVEQVLVGDRAQLALSMRTDYASWDEIARKCGYSSERTAFLAVKALMNQRQTQLDESLDHVRVRELERLERMSAAAQKVLDTDHYLVNAGRIVHHGPEGQEEPLMDDGPTLAAVHSLVKISESRRKLLGLDAAQRVQNDVHVQYTVEGIPAGEMP